MSDPFVDFCLGVQALRRTVEREIAGLGGATGVAAVPYPHQIANAQRVLTDSRIHHLIADEVGLGKTVQTLMILNALRIQNPRHRALILVPENLAPQWLLECQSRGHFMPLNYAPSEDETSAHVRLVYYEQLQSVTEIDPNVYDLLIVDEIHRLQSNLRQRIADVAGDFRQLLLLSATPRLEDVESFRQLLAILEPDRMSLAARTSDTPEALLRDREAAIAMLLATGATEQWAAVGVVPPPGHSKPATLAVTHSLLRRVTHTRRRDYPDLLPQRVLHRIAIEPTGDEVARQEQVWQFIGHADRSEASTDLARLGQVALRSPRALSERINILRVRDQRDPQGILQAATKYLDPANGDSRLEALIDLLVELWNANPEEAVLVVAEDNPTVDYLKRTIPQVLPEIGPRGQRRPLSVAVKRNRDAAATSNLVDLFDEHDENLGGFVNGDNQLLVAADVAQVGLNLQHARKLIFFSMPWSPAAVEQWIGRLDRLGSAALADQPGERTIDIYAIYQRGQVDERVVSVLNDFAVFERSIRLDGDEIKIVSQHIIDAAIARHRVNWQMLSQEARTIAGDNGDALATPLSAALPWRVEQVRALADYFDRVGALGPMLERSDARRAIVRIEAGLRGWMRLMRRADALRLWKKGEDSDEPSRKFRLLHYFRSSFATGPIEPRFPLPGLDPGDGQRYAYLDNRHALESPPITTVDIDDNPAAPLNFLDHGDPVHDTLIMEWTKIGKATPTCLAVRFPEGHSLANDAGRGIYLVALLSWVPGILHLMDLDRSHVLQQLQEARTQQERKPFLDAIQQMEEELRADRRWLNSLFTARLDVLAARYEKGGWSLVEPAVADALCTPWCPTTKGKKILAKGKKIGLTIELKAARSTGVGLLLQEHSARHRRSLDECTDLTQRIADRHYLVAAEAEDLIAWRQAQFDDVVALGLETSKQGFARSRFRTIQNMRNMAIYARDVRLARLDGLAQALSQPVRNEYKVLMLIVE